MVLSRATRCVAVALPLGCAIVAACSGGVSTTPRNVPSATPLPSPTATATATAAIGGQIVVSIPTPAPVVCSPAPVSVPVGQTAVIDCTSTGYSGPLTVSIGNSAVASVQAAAGTFTFFYVNGLQAGSTSVTFGFAGGGAGSDAITVTP